MRTQVVVIGGGHAGCEAALASARLGADTLLLTLDPDKIGHVSCNPAIGGVGKGQLVREIDALGGMMALAADNNALQFRMLNSSKGPAVRSPRAQIDRWKYQRWVRAYLERQPNLRIRLDQAVALETRADAGAAGAAAAGGRKIVAVRTFLGDVIHCDSVVICSGTFARGKLHLGGRQWAGGRAGEPDAPFLSESLEALGFSLFRLRTGTCPRIDSRSVDFTAMKIEEGDADAQPFSRLTDHARLENPDIPCHATWTTEETFRIVQENLRLAPAVTGAVAGAGPRYCPDFETKVANFPGVKRHHLFVEPEGGGGGRDGNSSGSSGAVEMYLNGLYLSLPTHLQDAAVRSVPGLENARIVRYGYSVEYDAIRPTELRDTLETKKVAGLFTAGQLNGTSGYEEAAAQGLLAGANAALSALGRPAFRIGRDQGYIGVLVDDLTVRGTEEPYRLFTSRAEHRLLLRQDNADLRLTERAASAGLAGPDRLDRVLALKKEIALGGRILQSVRDETGRDFLTLLRRPETTWEELAARCPELGILSGRAAEQLSIETKYEGYIARHLRQIRQLDRHRAMRLPPGIEYAALGGLSAEAVEKLNAFRPENLDQAMRISGVSPADAALLLVKLTGK